MSSPGAGTGVTEGALAAIGHDDSPLGLAGWILETFHAWCDIRRGMPMRTDRLIDNLKMYLPALRRRSPGCTAGHRRG
ncbi:hypothetical protein [Mycobacterium sp. 29Ha]|uniref:hypothetical protein n=1 Tax=Mycobacterium sp. 29Ha TaxID=2939268 RepID=UPI0029394D5F|nr:hypothetical protein [Mycobacterium sp. 29Ha]MDV3133719.1 hypothetical protein [Mycobacterium sp. 29Ha]